MAAIVTEASALDQLLTLCLPERRYPPSTDYPLDPADYSTFHLQAEKCLQTLERIISEKRTLTNDKWSALACCYAHAYPAPWTTEKAVALSTTILARISRPSDTIIFYIARMVGNRLTKTHWMYYTGERNILLSLCENFPVQVFDQCLPASLNLTDSHIPENQMLGLRCMKFLNRAISRTENPNNSGQVMLDALTRLSYEKNLEVLELTFVVMIDLLFTRGYDATSSDHYLRTLEQAAMASSLEDKKVFAEALHSFVARMGFAIREYMQTLLDIVEFWASISASRMLALKILHRLSCSGLSDCCYPRIVKILMQCVARNVKVGDQEVSAMILDCLDKLRLTVYNWKGSEEKKLFDLIKPAVQPS